MNRFEGKGVLVTGAASGIGQATVVRLLDDGATVVGLDLAETDLTAERYTYRRGDILDAEAVDEAVATVVAAAGRLDGVWCIPPGWPVVAPSICCPMTNGTGWSTSTSKGPSSSAAPHCVR